MIRTFFCRGAGRSVPVGCPGRDVRGTMGGDGAIEEPWTHVQVDCPGDPDAARPEPHAMLQLTSGAAI
jgi:hypothetical protein